MRMPTMSKKPYLAPSTASHGSATVTTLGFGNDFYEGGSKLW